MAAMATVRLHAQQHLLDQRAYNVSTLHSRSLVLARIAIAQAEKDQDENEENVEEGKLRRGWEEYATWCGVNTVPLFPLRGPTVALYVADRASANATSRLEYAQQVFVLRTVQIATGTMWAKERKKAHASILAHPAVREFNIAAGAQAPEEKRGNSVTPKVLRPTRAVAVKKEPTVARSDRATSEMESATNDGDAPSAPTSAAPSSAATSARAKGRVARPALNATPSRDPSSDPAFTPAKSVVPSALSRSRSTARLVNYDETGVKAKVRASPATQRTPKKAAAKRPAPEEVPLPQSASATENGSARSSKRLKGNERASPSKVPDAVARKGARKSSVIEIVNADVVQPMEVDAAVDTVVAVPVVLVQDATMLGRISRWFGFA